MNRIPQLRSLLLAFILIISGTNVLNAQQTGKVGFPNLGLEFTVPAGWMGQEGEGYYLIGHNSIPGIIFIIHHSSKMSRDQMLEETSKGLRFDTGTNFRPSGTVSTISDNAIGGEFEGTYDFNPAKAYIIGMENPHGSGITIVAVTTTENYTLKQYGDVARQVMNSVEFSEVKATSQGNNGALSGSLKDWYYQLGDTKLTFTESHYSGGEYGGGYNMKEEIHLCKAGHFLYYDQSMMAAGGTDVSGYSGSSSDGHGSWDVVDKGGTFVLKLNFNDGTLREYSLGWGENQELYMNGYRYYRTWEGKYAPDCF